jgi:uncharacterized protein (TIGR03083 family)
MSDRKQQLADEMTAARVEMDQAVAALTDNQLSRPTTNEGWNVRDVLAHLSSIEARMRERWEHILRGVPWPGEGTSVDDYNARCIAERRSWSTQQILEEFKRSARESLAFVERLQPGDLDKTYQHPSRGTVSLETQIRGVARHVKAHLSEVKAALTD